MCAVKDRNKDVRRCSIVAIMNVTTVIVAMVSNEGLQVDTSTSRRSTPFVVACSNNNLAETIK